MYYTEPPLTTCLIFFSRTELDAYTNNTSVDASQVDRR